MIKNKKAIDTATYAKVILVIVAIALLAYGYYGYIQVPKQPVGTSTCLLGTGHALFGGETQIPGTTTTCAYSLLFLIIGAVLLLAIIGLTFIKK